MSIVKLNNKIIKLGTKLITLTPAAPIDPGTINRLTNWTNETFDTFSSVGTSINSLIEAPGGTIGSCVSNSYPILAYGPTPGQWGQVTFRYYMTRNSGSGNLAAICYVGGSAQGQQWSNYSGPGWHNGGWLIMGSGNISIKLVNLDTNGINASAINCELFLIDGQP